jgi:hypothetical protein
MIKRISFAMHSMGNGGSSSTGHDPLVSRRGNRGVARQGGGPFGGATVSGGGLTSRELGRFIFLKWFRVLGPVAKLSLLRRHIGV